MQPAVIRPTPHRPRFLSYLGIAAWVTVCVMFGGAMLADHLLTLPAPGAGDATLQQAITAQRRPDQRDRWMAIHVIAESCGCSRRVLDRLLSAPRPSDVVERVVFIAEEEGHSTERLAAIRARGFDLDVVTPEQLFARYHIEAAPLLVVIDPHDAVQYVGGYTPRKQAADVRDLAIIDAARRGDPPKPLPAFGCAIGSALRSKLDPLGIKK